MEVKTNAVKHFYIEKMMIIFDNPHLSSLECVLDVRWNQHIFFGVS